jgi:hypothetical protein
MNLPTGHAATLIAEHLLQFGIHTDDLSTLHEGDTHGSSVQDSVLFGECLPQLDFCGLDAAYIGSGSGRADELPLGVVKGQGGDAQIN